MIVERAFDEYKTVLHKERTVNNFFVAKRKFVWGNSIRWNSLVALALHTSAAQRNRWLMDEGFP